PNIAQAATPPAPVTSLSVIHVTVNLTIFYRISRFFFMGEIWPYKNCLAVKSKFWPNTGFQYNIFSLATLKKSLAASGYNVEKNNSRLKLVLRSLVTKGMLLQIKGTGASGSFKLNKKRANPKDKATHKQQAAGAKKVKRAAGAAGAKKAVKKPASVAAKKPKNPAKLLKAKAKPKASTKAKPPPKRSEAPSEASLQTQRRPCFEPLRIVLNKS
uniref:H15 domain-containing protein n=1 Tax=Laticauda laticaudata TaxID=8630 RepID=A0A8C5RLD5_LATLA